MSINSINLNLGFISFEQASNLTQKTKQTLLALGIDPKSVSSETEALALINKILSQRVQLAKSTKTKSENCAEFEIISKAKSLASYAGITLKESVPIDKMLQKISDKLESISQKDADKLGIENYKKELRDLKNKYSELKEKENTMISSMDYNANLNKIILGL